MTKIFNIEEMVCRTFVEQLNKLFSMCSRFEDSVRSLISFGDIKITELEDYQHVFQCSKWIKWCILHRMALAFR